MKLKSLGKEASINSPTFETKLATNNKRKEKEK